jgi:hypothetical protein
MKKLLQISILIVGIIVAILCVKSTLSNTTHNYQKDYLGHSNKVSDNFNINILTYNIKK